MTAAGLVATPLYESATLEYIFNRCFQRSENTVLIGGASEPYYLPAADGKAHQLFYREDYFASALHEIAHWCIAGSHRRTLPDFGYWYAPEGRDTDAQRRFEAVEARPQALEWCLSRACGYRFGVSADNLTPDGSLRDDTRFRLAVLAQARDLRLRGLPPRASRFAEALARHFGSDDPLALEFSLAELR